MKHQKTILSLVFFTVLTCVLFSIVSCDTGKKTTEDNEVLAATNPSEDLITRGKYLVTVLGCNDCHSPKRLGPHGPEIIEDKMLGGFPADSPVPKAGEAAKGPWILFAPDLTAAVGPWGMSFAANISSDATGIGNWSEEQFFLALREGKYKGLPDSRNLLPPMPWEGYKSLSDDDISAIFLYLKNSKPVQNIVPAPIAPQDL